MALLSLSEICTVYQSIKENIYERKLPPCAGGVTCDKCWKFHNLLKPFEHYSEADQLYMLGHAITQQEISTCRALIETDYRTRHGLNLE